VTLKVVQGLYETIMAPYKYSADEEADD